jgi:hypothetical protein
LGVRYQVKDVSRSIDFYTKKLGFKLDMKNLPAFGQVSVGNLKLILSGPGASVRVRCLMVASKSRGMEPDSSARERPGHSN